MNRFNHAFDSAFNGQARLEWQENLSDMSMNILIDLRGGPT